MTTPDADAPVEHRQTTQSRWKTLSKHGPTVAEWRRACSCGHRGVWLRNPEKVAPCPRAREVR